MEVMLIVWMPSRLDRASNDFLPFKVQPDRIQADRARRIVVFIDLLFC